MAALHAIYFHPLDQIQVIFLGFFLTRSNVFTFSIQRATVKWQHWLVLIINVIYVNNEN